MQAAVCCNKSLSQFCTGEGGRLRVHVRLSVAMR